jgi:hypothetical protein
MEQIIKGRDGRLIQIEADVGNVAADLREIDPGLRLRYSELGEYFVVYHFTDLGNGETKEQLVLTAQECDARIVHRVKEIDAQSRSGYDFTAELERVDREREKRIAERFRERIGEASQRLRHAIRKDLGIKTTAHVPRDPDG